MKKLLFILVLIVVPNISHAARLWSSGFELATSSEIGTFGSGNRLPSYNSTTKRSGSYSMRINGLTSGVEMGGNFRYLTTAVGGPHYFRFYLNVATLPSSANTIFQVCSSEVFSPCTDLVLIRLNSNGTLELDIDATGEVAGTSSTALSTGQWYRIELFGERDPVTPNAGSDDFTLRINGVNEVVTTTASSAGPWRSIAIGGNLIDEAQTQGDWYFDDIAINDASGSSQTSWAGAGSIVHLRPNGAGEFSEPTATGVGTNWEALDELPIDYDTTYSIFATNSASWAVAASRLMVDTQNLSDLGVTAGSIALVSVGGMMRGATAATIGVVFSLQKQSGGTKSDGAEAGMSSLEYNVNEVSDKTYKLTTYLDPDGAAWTESTINSMQIGARGTDTNPDAYMTSLWALVEYTPAVPVSLKTKFLVRYGKLKVLRGKMIIR